MVGGRRSGPAREVTGHHAAGGAVPRWRRARGCPGECRAASIRRTSARSDVARLQVLSTDGLQAQAAGTAGSSSSGRPRVPHQQDRRPGDALHHPPSPSGTTSSWSAPAAPGPATALLLARAGHDVVLVDRATFPGPHPPLDPRHRPERRGAAPALGPARAGARIRRSAPSRHRLPRRRRRRDPPTRGAPRGRRPGGPPAHRARRAPRRGGPRRGRRRPHGRHGRGRHPDGHGPGLGVVARDGAGRLELAGRLVVGADGLRSRIARAVGAHAPRRGAPRIDPLHVRGGRLAAARVPPRRPGLRRGVPDARRRGVRVGLRPAEARAARRGAAADVDGAFDVLVRAGADAGGAPRRPAAHDQGAGRRRAAQPRAGGGGTGVGARGRRRVPPRPGDGARHERRLPRRGPAGRGRRRRHWPARTRRRRSRATSGAASPCSRRSSTWRAR